MVRAFRKEAAIFASMEGDIAQFPPSSMKALNELMYTEGGRLAAIKDEVDSAFDRYVDALGLSGHFTRK